MSPEERAAFFTVHCDLPREGPGEAADVLWALGHLNAGGPLDVMDAACGPGADLIGCGAPAVYFKLVFVKRCRQYRVRVLTAQRIDAGLHRRVIGIPRRTNDHTMGTRRITCGFDTRDYAIKVCDLWIFFPKRGDFWGSRAQQNGFRENHHSAGFQRSCLLYTSPSPRDRG